MTRVLFTTSELYPLVKTGGLADVSGSLPAALKTAGVDVRILLPGYPAAMSQVRQQSATSLPSLQVGQYEVRLWEIRLPETGVPVWLVDCPPMFDRNGSLYQNPEGQEWWDNAHRFALFGRVAVLLATGSAGTDWIPDIVHCNDWQSGLIPVWLATLPQAPATVFTIHNLAYQGLFDHDTFRALGLPDWLWHWERLEFHGMLSFIKGGLVYSDRITTVSPGYAREIQTPEFGHGLDDLLRHRREHLSGILNGIDTRVWNPATDRLIAEPFKSGQWNKKALCKQALLRETGLTNDDAPLIGFIGRLVEQKGVDWLLEVMPGWLERGCRFVILGSGEPHYEEPLQRLAEAWPGRVSVTLGYDEALSHRITAGCDALVMPSRFEPCGLNQLYGLRYGTVPIVHRVGGLADTVLDPDEAGPDDANGFCFSSPGAAGLDESLGRALAAFSDKPYWHRLQANGMARDFSWTRSARDYHALYQSILPGHVSDRLYPPYGGKHHA